MNIFFFWWLPLASYLSEIKVNWISGVPVKLLPTLFAMSSGKACVTGCCLGCLACGGPADPSDPHSPVRKLSQHSRSLQHHNTQHWACPASRESCLPKYCLCATNTGVYLSFCILSLKFFEFQMASTEYQKVYIASISILEPTISFYKSFHGVTNSETRVKRWDKELIF